MAMGSFSATQGDRVHQAHFSHRS